MSDGLYYIFVLSIGTIPEQQAEITQSDNRISFRLKKIKELNYVKNTFISYSGYGYRFYH